MLAPRLLFLLLFFNSGQSLTAQENDPDIRLAMQLDSMAATPDIHRHFAKIYSASVIRSIQHYQEASASEQYFIRRFEYLFAGYFFRAAASRGQGPGSEAWKAYFLDSTLSPLQYQLLGINAHINADLSVALIEGFSTEELKTHKKTLLRFQDGLRKQFSLFYEENRQATPLTRLLHQLSFGLARPYGTLMMYHWRKRQFRLAIWHTTRPEKEARLKRKTARHKERIDRLILRHL